jgi:hypothetical protein
VNNTVKGVAVAPVAVAPVSVAPDGKEWTSRWAEYRRWADAHAEPDPRSPTAIMADIDFLYRSYPQEVRGTDPDPQKLGIQNLRRVLAVYERKLQSRSSARRSR